jgi:cobyrinic acid a,c-diamide synthase
MMDKEHIQNLFPSVTEDADIAVIEGVMVLFDGTDPASMTGSTSQIAELLDAPVLLALNSHGMSCSFAALVKGLVYFEPTIDIACIIANHCGSPKHVKGLSASVTAANLPPLLGGIPRGTFGNISSRHLELVAATEQNLTKFIIGSLSDTAEAYISIQKLLQQLNVNKSSCPVKTPALTDAPAHLGKVRIGFTFDSAFHFYYQDLFD